MLRSEAIKQFLAREAPEFADLYHLGMEVQVNVAQDEGELVQGEYNGVPWSGWREPGTKAPIWKNFRIPWRANSEPEYEDREMKFSTDHIQSIGMTGWNWKERRSEWVGFDFDTLVDHVEGLTIKQIDEIKAALYDIPWVTIRRSKGGLGLHIYVFLHVDGVRTHTEHAALARAVLGEMDSLVSVDLRSAVDKLGGILWCWHRDCKPGGLRLLKQGAKLDRIPENWRDHEDVVAGRGHMVKGMGGIEALVSAIQSVPLETAHLDFIKWLREQPEFSQWDSDRRMLVTHTKVLERAHKQLGLKGIFYTNATGKDLPNDKNCFLFPIRGGAWVVRRFGLNAKEHASWSADAKGWTKCLFNHPCDLDTAAAAHDGIENVKSGYVFRTAFKAMAALNDLGVTHFDIAPNLGGRKAEIQKLRNGKLVFRMARDAHDAGMDGWLPNKRGDMWERILEVEEEQELPEPPDEMIRHVVASNEDAGWYILSRAEWIREPRSNVVSVLKSQGMKAGEVEGVLGLTVLNPWILENMPFKPEYPGGRRWNRDAAQLAFKPQVGPHPTWDSVLNHVFSSLDYSVQQNAWCQANAVARGADWGRLWVAAIFQEPMRPLPYLFLHGPQASGKSTLHEALHLLFANPRRGCVRADNALRSKEGFNGELAGAVLGIIEEINLRESKGAYDRVKDWTTARTIPIHPKGGTVYDLPNSLHFIQCANDPSHCPVQSGDTRITMVYVGRPEVEVSKGELMERLREEAPYFLHTVLNLELPHCAERLTVPVIETAEKEDQIDTNKSELERFIEEECYVVEGAATQVSHFYEAFFKWLPLDQHAYWTQRRVAREMPITHPKGRYTGEGQIHFGNISLIPTAPGPRLVRRGDRLAAE